MRSEPSVVVGGCEGGAGGGGGGGGEDNSLLFLRARRFGLWDFAAGSARWCLFWCSRSLSLRVEW